jgi:hypothetical protein
VKLQLLYSGQSFCTVVFIVLCQLLASSFSFPPPAWAYVLSWPWQVQVYATSPPRPSSFRGLTLPLWVFWWFPKWLMGYLHANDIFLLEYSEFSMIVVFLFDHLRHFFQLLVISLGHLCSDTYDSVTHTEETLVDFGSFCDVFWFERFAFDAINGFLRLRASLRSFLWVKYITYNIY